MKLNPDCIRDVMLTLEEHLKFEDHGDKFGGIAFAPVRIEVLILLLEQKGYSSDDISYSALQLIESKYIVTNRNSPIDEKARWLTIGDIIYITPAGHEFISSIHDKETWKRKISPILNILGNVSLSVIESVSKGIANAAIEKLLLNPPEDML